MKKFSASDCGDQADSTVSSSCASDADPMASPDLATRLGRVARKPTAAIAAAMLALACVAALAGCAQSTTMGGTSSTSGSTSANSMSSSASGMSSSSTDMMGSDSMASTATSDGYTIVSPDAVKMMIDNGGVTVVDIRTAGEYATKRLPGAINIPLESISTTKPDGLPDLGATVILYCNTTMRGEQAAQKLAAIGYKDLYVMEGGISAWTYETES